MVRGLKCGSESSNASVAAIAPTFSLRHVATDGMTSDFSSFSDASSPASIDTGPPFQAHDKPPTMATGTMASPPVATTSPPAAAAGAAAVPTAPLRWRRAVPSSSVRFPGSHSSVSRMAVSGSDSAGAAAERVGRNREHTTLAEVATSPALCDPGVHRPEGSEHDASVAVDGGHRLQHDGLPHRIAAAHDAMYEADGKHCADRERIRERWAVALAAAHAN